MKKQMAHANIDDKTIVYQEAIILSMTKKERRNPKILNAKRRIRIANGSGTTVQEVNRLLKQHKQIAHSKDAARNTFCLERLQCV